MGQSQEIIGLPWKSVVVAAALVLGGANITTHTAFGRGMSAGAHFVGDGFAGHRLAISHGFFHRRRNFAPGGWWPYDYDYGPTDEYGDVDTISYPETDGFVPEPMPAPICHRSEEIVRVPAEGGGTRRIKIVVGC